MGNNATNQFTMVRRRVTGGIVAPSTFDPLAARCLTLGASLSLPMGLLLRFAANQGDDIQDERPPDGEDGGSTEGHEQAPFDGATQGPHPPVRDQPPQNEPAGGVECPP